MIELDNQTELDVDIEALEKIALLLTDASIELIITDNEIPGMPLGSIVISETYVREKAVEFGHTPDDELALLFIHGLLHLLGYDHEVDDGEMRAKEQELIEQFHLPKSLIVRTTIE